MITEAEQSVLDIDWFFTDGHNIGFVASGGGKLPEAISKSNEDIEEMALYFRGLPITTDPIVNPKLNEVMSGRAVNDRYLLDFIDMAKKGLYAFDKSILNNFFDGNYHLVARPVRPMKLNELPTKIAHRLIRTRDKRKIADHLSIDAL